MPQRAEAEGGGAGVTADDARLIVYEQLMYWNRHGWTLPQVCRALGLTRAMGSNVTTWIGVERFMVRWMMEHYGLPVELQEAA